MSLPPTNFRGDTDSTYSLLLRLLFLRRTVETYITPEHSGIATTSGVDYTIAVGLQYCTDSVEEQEGGMTLSKFVV